MKKKTQCIIIIFTLLLVLHGCSTFNNTTKRSIIEKGNIASNNLYKKGYNSLLKKADIALASTYKSVVDKSLIPPSGDKHDYYSTAVYYWENPNTKNGLPWVYKDGEYNGPALKKTDHSNYYKAMEAIRDLALAYEYSSENKYAQKSIFLIKQWFISDSTKMNPNLNYAQGIPGLTDGYASGIIDSRAILWVIDSIPIIKESNNWNEQIEIEFKTWCSQYLDWLLTSEFGKKEAKSKNNHGTFYDLQVATFATFVGNHKLAINTIENAKKIRIELQIKPDGSMPEELKRTRAFKYSLFNLSAYFELAMLSDNFGIDLWNYKNEKCGSVKDAFDFVLNNAIFNDNWKYEGKVEKDQIIGLLHIATKYIDNSYSIPRDKLLKEKSFEKISDIYFVQ
jgi:hypothetical protein